MRGRGPSRWTRLARVCAPAAAATVVWLSGCGDDMRDQPRADALEASRFFTDGTTARPRVPGTVAVGDPIVPPDPPPVTMELLRVGRDRFNGICAVCHARDGYGAGVVVQRGFPAPPSLHEERLRLVDDAHLLRVIDEGLGKMPAYGPMLDAHERAAVVAYVRALQLSQHADVATLGPGAAAPPPDGRGDPGEGDGPR